jgi:hypothetical protein
MPLIIKKFKKILKLWVFLELVLTL